MVTTMHSSLEPDFPYLAERFKGQNYVSISNAQRELAPYLNYVDTIYHGLQNSEYKPRLTGDSDYYLFLGSFIRNKGVDIAVKAAKELGINLLLAGEFRETERDFYKKEVEPYVDGKQIEVLGEVSTEEKNRLLRGAKALLFPSQWKEAFGLVIIEALTHGTPVVAYGNGAVPEIIVEGKTGYVVDNYDDFKSKILEVGGLSRKACREEAEIRFDVSVVVDNYIRLFEKLAKGHQ
jgi:glycosyltransferase involved in cell wall biosynthesis